MTLSGKIKVDSSRRQARRYIQPTQSSAAMKADISGHTMVRNGPGIMSPGPDDLGAESRNQKTASTVGQ
jgi:hypothetical protein